MARYQLTVEGVFDTEKNRAIPDNENNRHWREYLIWLDEGNTPDPIPDEPEEVADPKIAMIDDMKTIGDVQDFFRYIYGYDSK